MNEMSSSVAMIATIILAIILWRFYHKIVHKVYFGNMMQAVIGEILVSLVISFFIVAAAKAFLGWVFGGVISFTASIMKLAWSVIKIAVVVGGIGGIIFIIYKAVSAKGKSTSNKSTEAKNNNSDMPTDMQEKNNMNEFLICPECGTSNDFESIFCEKCGSRLQKEQQDNKQETMEDMVEQVRYPQCGNLLSNEDKFCTYCGAKMPKDIKFCTSCGKAFKSATAPMNTTDSVEDKRIEQNEKNNEKTSIKPKKNKKGLLLGIVGITVVIILILYFIGRGTDTDLNPNNTEGTLEKNSLYNSTQEIETIFEEQSSEMIMETESMTESENSFETSEYILPDSNTRYLTEGDVEGLSKDEIRIAINEIYARHGRMFQTEDLNAYFSSKSWYEPKYSAEEFSAIESSIMNDYEKKNIEFLAEVRDGKSGSGQAFEEDWMYGMYYLDLGEGGITAEIGYYIDSGEDYLSLSGSYLDSYGEFSGTITHLDDGTMLASSEFEESVRFEYNGKDQIEILSADNTGGMDFPGFEGVYQKTEDFPR
mgnify:CR=1 FL=1